MSCLPWSGTLKYAFHESIRILIYITQKTKFRRNQAQSLIKKRFKFNWGMKKIMMTHKLYNLKDAMTMKT